MRDSNTAERLKLIMQEQGLSQTDIIDRYNRVAKQLGEKPIGKGAISYYVNGKVEPKQSKIYILAKALNVSEAWLMGYDVDRERIFDTPRQAFSPLNFSRHVKIEVPEEDTASRLYWSQHHLRRLTSSCSCESDPLLGTRIIISPVDSGLNKSAEDINL